MIQGTPQLQTTRSRPREIGNSIPIIALKMKSCNEKIQKRRKDLTNFCQVFWLKCAETSIYSA